MMGNQPVRNFGVWKVGRSYKATTAGHLSIYIDIQNGQYVELIWLVLGPDNYSANETVFALVKRGATTVLYLIQNTAVDNKRMSMTLAIEDSDEVQLDLRGASVLPLPMLENERLYLQASNIAINEVLTFDFGFKIFRGGTLPIITTNNATLISSWVEEVY